MKSKAAGDKIELMLGGKFNVSYVILYNSYVAIDVSVCERIYHVESIFTR